MPTGPECRAAGSIQERSGCLLPIAESIDEEKVEDFVAPVSRRRVKPYASWQGDVREAPRYWLTKESVSSGGRHVRPLRRLGERFFACCLRRGQCMYPVNESPGPEARSRLFSRT